MSTFDYIMSKREKQQEIKEKLKELEEALKREEEKFNRHNNLSWSKSSSDPPRLDTQRLQEEHCTKGSTKGEMYDETSKGSLLMRKNTPQ